MAMPQEVQEAYPELAERAKHASKKRVVLLAYTTRQILFYGLHMDQDGRVQAVIADTDAPHLCRLVHPEWIKELDPDPKRK